MPRVALHGSQVGAKDETQNAQHYGLPSRKLRWKPKKAPIKTIVLLKGGYMGFHVSLGEFTYWGLVGNKGIESQHNPYIVDSLIPY